MVSGGLRQDFQVSRLTGAENDSEDELTLGNRVVEHPAESLPRSAVRLEAGHRPGAIAVEDVSVHESS
jgi:hypothetical protein